MEGGFGLKMGGNDKKKKTYETVVASVLAVGEETIDETKDEEVMTASSSQISEVVVVETSRLSTTGKRLCLARL